MHNNQICTNQTHLINRVINAWILERHFDCPFTNIILLDSKLSINQY